MKFLDRGFWIAKHFYWQSMAHYVINCVRFRSMTFFSVANPAIDLGGMLSDRKTEFYELAPSEKVPFTTIATTLDAAKVFMSTHELDFPIIIKPNVGYKGMDVQKIDGISELDAFFLSTDTQQREWIIQEFVAYEREFSVLVYKYPTSKKYGITSFIEKIYPSVTADGKSTYGTLIDSYNNPFLKKAYALKRYKDVLETVPKAGTKIVLDYIGNYSQGAKFYSRNEYITPEMEKAFYEQYKHQEGLNFFRIDCKAESLENCQEGVYKILEINGMKGEPLHIYDPNSTVFSNSKAISLHWKHIKNVIAEQKQILNVTPSFSEGLRSLKELKDQFK